MGGPPPNRRLPPPPPQKSAQPAEDIPLLDEIPISTDSEPAPPPEPPVQSGTHETPGERSMVPTAVGIARLGSVPKAPALPREASQPGAYAFAPSPAADGPPDTATVPAAKGEQSGTIRNPSSSPPSARNTLRLPAICNFGRYELLGRLALGGMAEIFLARESTSGANRYLVIKRILPHVADDEQFINMFLDEAHLAMRLNHPGICHIYEFGQELGSYFIAMEWVNGVALGKLIRRSRGEGGVPIPIAAKIMANVAEALHYAHRARDENGRPLEIVHRDVSPQNVMVTYDGNVKLLDFGIAKAATHATRTQAGQVKGKFAYMSPQQCLGDNIDGRADVFALGVCMYELLTGKPLYHRKTEYETMRAVIEDPVPSIRGINPSLPEGLDAIVQKALAKNPEERYQTAGEMQTALEEFLAESRMVVNAAKVADFMEKLYSDEIRRGPLVDSTPFGASFVVQSSQRHFSPGTGSRSAASAAKVAQTPQSVEVDVPPRKSRAGLIGFLAVLLLAGAGGTAWWWSQQGQDASTGTAAVAPQSERGPRTPPPDPEADDTPSTAPDPEAGDTVGLPPVANGRVTIRSTPAGARVVMGGDPLDSTTPIAIADVTPGTYPLAITLEGYEPWSGEVTVRPGELTTVDAPLARVRHAGGGGGGGGGPPGELSVNTRPWSKVYVGSRLLGTTPIGSVRVPSGAVRLRLVDRDGNTHRRTVQVTAGGHANAFFDLTQGQ